MPDNTRRFSDRVEDYLRYRPGYPDELVTALLGRCGLKAGATVADIGAGTGIFTAKLLDAGLRVFGVEPNAEMRNAAKQLLAGRSGFTSVAAPAESTGLDTGSLDLITAAQAFHWFDNETARAEFRRILKPLGHLALIWNRRRIEQAFQRDYDDLLRHHSTDYGKLHHMNLDDERISAFFGHDAVAKLHFENRQRLDFDALLGRLQSASYCPPRGSDAFAGLRDDLRALFDKYAVSGVIDFDYDTQLYLGRLRR